jgi:hypothetical protein
MNAEDDMIKSLSKEIDKEIMKTMYYDDKLSLYGGINNMQTININTSYKNNNVIINDNKGNELVKIETETGNFYIKGS